MKILPKSWVDFSKVISGAFSAISAFFSAKAILESEAPPPLLHETKTKVIENNKKKN
jgi:hypothetical protein